MDQKQICLNTNIHIKDGHKNVINMKFTLSMK